MQQGFERRIWNGSGVVPARLVYTELSRGRNMNRRNITIFGAALYAAAMAAVPSAAWAQSSFRNYGCADGTQFMVGFFQYDSRAHLQLAGKAGITTLKHARRPVTTCEQT